MAIIQRLRDAGPTPRWFPLLVLATALLIATLDLFSGPAFRLPLLTVVPVLFAAWFGYRTLAIGVAVVVPLARTLLEILVWHTNPPALSLSGFVIRIAGLLTLALICGTLGEHTRRLLVKLANIVDAADDAIISLKRNGTIETWNAGAERLFGYTADEVVGRSVWLLVPAEYVTEAKALFEPVVHGEHIPPYETMRLRKDGTAFDVSVASFPIRGSSGAVIGVGKIVRDITERKRTEAALRQSQQRDAALFANAPIPAVLMKLPDNVFVDINNAFERLVGYTKQELIGKTSLDAGIAQADERAQMVAAIEGNGREVSRENHIRTKSGDLRTVSSNATRIEINDQSYIIATLIDITARRKAEADVRSTVRLLRSIGENFPHSYIYVIDSDLIIGFTTGQEFKHSNLDPNTLVGLHIRDAFEAFGDETLQRITEKYRAAFTGIEQSFELRVGNQYHSYDVIPLRDDNGQIQQILSVVQNITGRKRDEAALRAAETKYRTLVEQIPATTYLVEFGEHNTTTYVSPQIHGLLGYTPEEWLADRSLWFGRVHPDDYAWVKEQFRQNAIDRRPLDAEYRMLTRDNREVWIHNTASRIISLPGQTPFSIGIFFDITDRKRAEEEQLQLATKLQQTQKLESLGVLSGGIAHDFNNLLTGILGYADLALLELPPHSSARPLIHEAVNGARRATELTAQMLAYSGKGRFVVEPLDLSSLIEDMSRLLEISISKKCVLKYDLMPDLPSVEADATQFRQVVMNLVINASDAIGERSGVIALATGVMYCDRAYLSETYLDDDLPEGMYVYLEVADNGVGMTEDTRLRVFEPFFTTKFTGRGLGLAAVLGIVRGHRGAIKIYSEVGKGTTFKVLFPATNMPAKPLEEPASMSALQMFTGTVLVIDDEETVRGLVRSMLERMGFAVLSAADGREGVAVFRANAANVRLVLLDMTMPHMDGEATFRELRRIRIDVRAILSSGYNEQTATSRFVGKGLAAFIQKPFRFEQLQDVVRKVLEGDQAIEV